MAIVNVTALESNKNFKISFDGGNLSSDGGPLLLKEVSCGRLSVSRSGECRANRNTKARTAVRGYLITEESL